MIIFQIHLLIHRIVNCIFGHMSHTSVWICKGFVTSGIFFFPTLSREKWFSLGLSNTPIVCPHFYCILWKWHLWHYASFKLVKFLIYKFNFHWLLCASSSNLCLFCLRNRNKRTKDHPWTPPKQFKYSRRAFDGLIKGWRTKLHCFDPPNNKGTDEIHADSGTSESDDDEKWLAMIIIFAS